MRPVVFSDTIGWLTEAGGGRGVVIAGAHGFEDLCSRRFLKLLAERIAAAGCPVIQFDYPGCGDAAGDHSQPGQVAAWTDSIGAAIDRLKHETGVADVILVGFRLGALLAPMAAARRGDVAGLALLAPPASGKAYVREMTALSRMIDAPLAAGNEDQSLDGRQIAGFRLSSETLEDMAPLDWQADLAKTSVSRALVMANGKFPAMPALKDRNGAQTEVTAAEFDGYSLLMCDPTANQIPLPALECCVSWVVRDAGQTSAVAASPSRQRQLLIESDYQEEPVMIGPEPRICGVLCRPRGRPAQADPVIFLNAGAVPHVGWARGTVEAARALAAEGVTSLRIDLLGLGQSETPRDERMFLYDRRIRDDVVRVIGWMEQAGFPRVGLVGTCSGAFQAFHAARADKRVDRLTMINPLCFSWNSSYALEMAVWKAYETSKVTLGKGREAVPRSDRRTHSVRIRAAVSSQARVVVRSLLEMVKTTLSTFGPAKLLYGSQVERWMRELANRGVRVLIVTSDGDLSLKEIDRHFGPEGEGLRTMRGVARLSLAAADHTLTPYHARRALIARLIDFGVEPAEKAGRQSAAPLVATPLLEAR